MKEDGNMKVIGITGSSGSGKTTISEILDKRQDTKVINADKIAKSLTNSETQYFAEIKDAFQKQDILLEDGNLNRAKLADLIYHDEKSLEKLNQITFKHLLPKIADEMQNVETNIKFIVIDAPLLFEAGLDKFCDVTVAVQTTESTKIKRICERDHISEKMAKDRLKIQKTNEFYRGKVDYVIENDEETTLEELEKELKAVTEFKKPTA